MQAAEGMLTGQLRIGPTRPVATNANDPNPNLFKGRSILIYDSASWLVKKLSVAEDGSFAIALPEGDYSVDISLQGIERAADLPLKIKMQKGHNTKVVIDIDTGIR